MSASASFDARVTPGLLQLVLESPIRPNEQPLNPANWAIVQPLNEPIAVVSDVFVAGSPDLLGSEVYIGPNSELPSDSYASVTIASLDPDGEVDIFLKTDVDASKGYLLQIFQGEALLFDLTGHNDVIADAVYSTVIKSGDVFVLVAQGTRVKTLFNGVVIIDVEDSNNPGPGLAGMEIAPAAVQSDTSVALFTAGALTVPSLVNTLNGFLIPNIETASTTGDRASDSEAQVTDFQSIPRVIIPEAEFAAGATGDTSVHYTKTDWK